MTNQRELQTDRAIPASCFEPLNYMTCIIGLETTKSLARFCEMLSGTSQNSWLHTKVQVPSLWTLVVILVELKFDYNLVDIFFLDL